MSDQPWPHAAEAALPQATCSAMEVAEMVARARDHLADALKVIEQRKTFPGGRWRDGMRTRGEAEGKYRLREALVELRSKAEWLVQDAKAPNGGWPNTKFSRAADEPQPATTTPPALAETPCSAADQGDRNL